MASALLASAAPPFSSLPPHGGGAGSIAPPSGGGNGDGGGPGKPLFPLGASVQRSVQNASLDRFSATNLSAPEFRVSSSIIWCDGVGLHVNPTEISVRALAESGINPDDQELIVLSESSEEIAKGLINVVLKRKRIKVLAGDSVFEDVCRIANGILGDKSDIRSWVDRLAADRDGKYEINFKDEKATISLLQNGN